MRKNFLFFGIAFLVVVIDQITKFAITSKLAFSESITVINNFLYFTLIKNFGIGFGLLNNPASRWILILTTIIIIGIILYYYKEDMVGF